MCGIEQQSSKRRQGDQSSLRSRSSRGVPLEPGYQCSGLPVPDISSQTDFMDALTYPPDNMPGWCIAGLIASVRKHSPMVPIRCSARRSLKSIARLATVVLSSSYSEGRHTAREQQAEARITYRFHPRFGETVGVRRRLERGGGAFLVVHQLDGRFGCLPAWMTDEAEIGR